MCAIIDFPSDVSIDIKIDYRGSVPVETSNAYEETLAAYGAE
jgi:hypothetical protein